MMTQRLASQALNQLSTPKASDSLSRQQTSKSVSQGFGDLMDRNVKSDDKNSDIKETKKPDIKKTAEKENAYGNNANVKSNENAQAPVDDIKVDGSEETADTSLTSENVIEEVADKVESIINDILKNFLGVTDEELEKHMSELGFQMMDLYDPAKLQQLVINVNQLDNVSDLLINENASNQLSDIMNQLEQVLNPETTELSEKELSVLSDMVKDITNNVVEDQPQKEINFNLEDNTKIDSDKDEEIPVIVKKDNSNENSGSHMEDSEKDSSDVHNKDLTSVKSEQKSSLLENIVNQFVGVQENNSIQNFDAQVRNVREMREIVNQIVEQIKVTIKPDNTSMELLLNPESLGRVNLSVVSKNGTMTAQFVVQNEAAKEAIQSQLQILKENFENQGIKVEAVEVTVSNFGFGQSDNTGSKDGAPKKQTRKNINVDSIRMSDDTLSEEEEIAVDIMEQNGSSIDYTA